MIATRSVALLIATFQVVVYWGGDLICSLLSIDLLRTIRHSFIKVLTNADLTVID
jgi:hypothetical protein